MQCTYSTCLAFFLFSLHPSSPLSVSQPQTLLSAPTVKMRWSLGNHSACCSHHHWMLSWRSWDSEVKSDYSPDKWGVCVCVSGSAHTRQQLWQKIVKGYTWWVVGPLWASATTEHCHFFRTSILPLSLSHSHSFHSQIYSCKCFTHTWSIHHHRNNLPLTFAFFILLAWGPADLETDLYSAGAFIVSGSE